MTPELEERALKVRERFAESAAAASAAFVALCEVFQCVGALLEEAAAEEKRERTNLTPAGKQK